MHNMSDEQQQQQQQQQQPQQTQQKRLQQHQEQVQQQQHQQQQQQQQHAHKMCKENSMANGNAVATTTAAETTTHTPSTTPTSGTSTASVGAAAAAAAATATPRKTNPHELRNSEYVSRLMAATPPYLYSAPVGPNNFFFSDMLRSLVQARNSENVRNLQLQQSIIARRSRKRSWSQHRPYVEHMRVERRELLDGKPPTTAVQVQSPMLATLPQQLALAQQQQQEGNNGNSSTSEKPLELTNKTAYYLGASKYRKLEDQITDGECEKKLAVVAAAAAANAVSTEPHVMANSNQSSTASSGGGGGAVDCVLHDTPPAASLPPQDLVLPPPPIWYPPHLYPPYGIDPLHFFIDLRVSGHIYDRKKENLSPLMTASNENNNNNSNNNGREAVETAATQLGALPLQLPQKYRQGSAFSVPVPRANERKTNGSTAGGGGVGGGSGTNNAAINLSSKFEHYAKYYDFGEEKEKENQPTTLSQPAAVGGAANYMLQQLPRLYSQFAAGQAVAAVAHAASDGDNKSEPDCCDGDSDGDGGGIGGGTNDDDVDTLGGNGNCERDIDVEFIDSIQRSIKYRRGMEAGSGRSSRCSSADETSSITQID